MLVLSRRKGESVMIGDEFLVTVEEIKLDSALVAVRRIQLGGRDEVTARQWLGLDDVIPIGEQASCKLVRPDHEGKVRLGFLVPRSVSVHRQEVYEVICQQNGGRGEVNRDHA